MHAVTQLSMAYIMDLWKLVQVAGAKQERRTQQQAAHYFILDSQVAEMRSPKLRLAVGSILHSSKGMLLLWKWCIVSCQWVQDRCTLKLVVGSFCLPQPTLRERCRFMFQVAMRRRSL